ncbi:hypothetical protein JQ615_35020 [Bradyrhizobium jicamae]|uniref:Fe-S protein n=1 Tax=Bradyrhizobium jicamae TaxID=280332 RepID=A0ABS5FVH8_9BRAD|nr:hypothetical protein [Bradyrhizobium jicamae]MBR0800589.1 hypothetical protein [Bradyrhizobium jicamae]
MNCPFCMFGNCEGALVCIGCARDIAVPESLIAERDNLVRKREQIRAELQEARRELDAISKRRQRRQH